MTSPPGLVPLDPAGFRRTPWKNGGGVTLDIADLARPDAEPGGWEGTVWRFGRTAITAPGPFSDLSGHDRVLVVLEGSGLVLRVADGREIDVRRPFRPTRFPGEWAITSRLEQGPVEVLNLIGDRRAVAIDLRCPVERETLALAPGEHVLYAPREAAQVRLDGSAVAIAAGWAIRFRREGPTTLRHAAGIVALASIADRRG